MKNKVLFLIASMMLCSIGANAAQVSVVDPADTFGEAWTLQEAMNMELYAAATVYTDVATAEGATGNDNNLCYVVETETYYRYEDTGAAHTDDDTFVLSTGDGGDTRWLAVAGQYVVEGLNIKGLQVILPVDESILFDGRTNPRLLTLGAVRQLHTAGMSGTRAVLIDVDSAGYDDTRGLTVRHDLSGSSANINPQGLNLTADITGATNVHLDFLKVNKVGDVDSGTILHALDIREDIVAIHQHVGTFGAIEQAWDFNGGYVDTTTALSVDSTNVQLFNNNNDYLYIGNDVIFDDIEVVLDIIASNPGVKPEFEYSQGAGSWATLPVVDNTNGFRQNGLILTTPQIDWDTDTVNGVTKYWVRIGRTAVSLGTPPTESTIKTTTSETFYWDENGDLLINSLTLASDESVVWGEGTAEGDWRIKRDGTFLVFERMESSTWVQKGRFEDSFYVEDLHLGPDMTIAAAGHHILIRSKGMSAGQEQALALSIPFGDSGTKFPLVPILQAKDVKEIYQADNGNEITGTVIGWNYNQTFGQIVDSLWLQTGTTVPTTLVKLCIYFGTDNTGDMMYEKVIHPGEFLVSTEIQLMLPNAIGLPKNVDFFFEISSTSTFSLLGDTAGTEPWWAIDRWIGAHQKLAHAPGWSAKTWTEGDVIVQGGMLYVCNTTGGQVTDFATNVALWDEFGAKITSNNTQIDTHVTDATKHRLINDSGESSTELWSANKINAELTVLSSGYSRRKAVINIVDCTSAPPTEVTNDRYIIDFTVGAVHANWDGASKGSITQFNGTTWDATTPSEGWITYLDTQNKDSLYIDDGSPEWEIRSVSVSSHLDLTDIGTNSHIQIDSHLSNTTNPHLTDIENIGDGTLSELNAAITDATLIDTADSRLSDDRTADGIRTATTVVSVSSSTAPTAGQLLTATSGTVAEWARIPGYKILSSTAFDARNYNDVPLQEESYTKSIFTQNPATNAPGNYEHGDDGFERWNSINIPNNNDKGVLEFWNATKNTLHIRNRESDSWSAWTEIGASEDNIYSEDGTIGSGRAVAITDTLNFDSDTLIIDGTNDIVKVGAHTGTMPTDTGLWVSGYKTFRVGSSDANVNYSSYIKGDYIGGTVLTFGTRDATVYEDTFSIKAGNLGIGTNDPGAKLDVSGDVIITGNSLSVDRSLIPTTGSDRAAFNFGGGGSLIGATSDVDAVLTQNAYYNSGYKYLTSDTGGSGRVQLNNGGFIFSNAVAGSTNDPVSFTDRLTIGSDGTVDIPGVYSQTSSNAPNVYVASDGSVMRSTATIGDSIYSANGTVGSGRTVAITDSINFDSGTLFVDGTNDNVGIGVGSMETWASNWTALQVGNSLSFMSQDGVSNSMFAQNAYFDGVNWKYQNTNFAMTLQMIDGDFNITTAPSGTEDTNIAFTNAMTINSTGTTLQSGTNVNEFSIDGTLSGNSDDVIPTEKAVKTYVDSAVSPESWIAPTLLNSWVNLGTVFQVAQYRRQGKLITVRGIIKNGVITVNTVLFTLPVGYRPSTRRIFITDSATGDASLSVHDTGNVTIQRDFATTWSTIEFQFYTD